MSLAPLLLFRPENPDRRRHADAVTSDPTARPLPRCPQPATHRPAALLEVPGACDGEPESGSVAICALPGLGLSASG